MKCITHPNLFAFLVSLLSVLDEAQNNSSNLQGLQTLLVMLGSHIFVCFQPFTLKLATSLILRPSFHRH